MILSIEQICEPAVLENSEVLTNSIYYEWYLCRLKPDGTCNNLPLNRLFEVRCVKVLRCEHIVQLNLVHYIP